MYDRLEVNELLEVLRRNDILAWRCAFDKEDIQSLDVSAVLALDGSEENAVFWFAGQNKRWYYLY